MGIIIGVAGLSLMNRVQPAPLIIQAPSATVTPVPTNTPGPIRVFVNGQVVSAAVYELPTNSIVDAANQAAGGFTDEANTAVVN
jgi:protein involved in polysaccharide export with SLBB domain